jgi:hypothetical protein
LLASGLGVIREFGLLLAGAVLIAWLAATCVVAVSCPPPPRQPQRRSPSQQKVLMGART